MLHNERHKSSFCRTNSHVAHGHYGSIKENHGTKKFRKIPQLVSTLSSRKNCTVSIKPNKVKGSYSMSALCCQFLSGTHQPQFKIGNKIRIAKLN